jgi:hypothetical protein
MKYEVGQIIYLLNNQEMRIFPARVEEEVIRRRIGSEDFTYKVMLPTKTRDVVDLHDLDVTVYTSASLLRDHMVSNAVKTIDALLDRATKVSRSLASDSVGSPVVQEYDNHDIMDTEAT